MRTERFLDILAADAPVLPVSVARRLAWAALVGLALAAAAALALFGPRPDFFTPGAQWAMARKMALGAALAAGAMGLMDAAARPAAGGGRPARLWLALLAAPLALLAAYLVVEEARLGAADWRARAVGVASWRCAALLLALSAAPFAAFLLALSAGVNLHPARSGALAGLAASGLAILAYALHCGDDSALFLLAWYVPAAAVAAGLGALAGARLLRL